MKAFQAERVEKSYTFTVNSPASHVFPLLCPVREYDWIEPWKCEMIWSDSGVAENNCIFKTDFPGRGVEIWTVSRYEPDAAIEFVRMCPGETVTRLNIALTPKGEGQTELIWTNVTTGLNAAGNEKVKGLTDAVYQTEMQALEQMLRHFLETGRMLKGFHLER